ncbi:MAG: hypothetical protein L6R41_004711 [Letrouitia leprolyta]|nr:MAG: hypothetical protein L6R41_004711 [Letrouitia leprolyta]
MPTNHHILALIFNDFEALDFFGPIGSILPRSDYYTLSLVNVHNLPTPYGLESTIKNGIGIVPTISLADALKTYASKADSHNQNEHFDTLFIPGGPGMLPLTWDPVLLRQIGRLVDLAPNVFTVCTGSVVLAATGSLDGRKATTNKRSYEEHTRKSNSKSKPQVLIPAFPIPLPCFPLSIRITPFPSSRSAPNPSICPSTPLTNALAPIPTDPSINWQKRARWVEDGKFLTSSGVTAGMDAGFYFLSKTYLSPSDRQSPSSPSPSSSSLSNQDPTTNSSSQSDLLAAAAAANANSASLSRQADLEARSKGDATPIPGFDAQKALEYARHVAYELEYRWHEDPHSDPFVRPSREEDGEAGRGEGGKGSSGEIG